MNDQMVVAKGSVTLKTSEGGKIVATEDQLMEMIRREIEPPINGVALPDGVKFVQWNPPFLGVVHQLPAHVRQLRWITDDSPAPFGPEAEFQVRRLSMPYAITIAVFALHGRGLGIMSNNELFFRNEPLKSRDDRLGYPALLNVSRIDNPGRCRAWICTQYLRVTAGQTWVDQLAALLDHTWNGGFNRSSEHHEGSSWYGESKGVHQDLHPISRWEKATQKNDAFALGVNWKPVPLTVGQVLDAMLAESGQSLRPVLRSRPGTKKSSLEQRFLNFMQRRRPK